MIYGNSVLDLKTTSQLRGIAILTVIIGHIGIIKNAGAWGVTIFLLLSGFGLTQSYLKSGLTNFFRNKIIKVLVPYSIVTIIWFILDAVIYKTSYGVIRTVLTIFGLGVKSPVDGTMWYITFILIWYVIFYVVFRFNFSLKTKSVLMFIVSIVCYTAITALLPNTTIIRNYSFAMSIGVLISVFYRNIVNKDIKKLKKILLFSTILGFTVFYLMEYLVSQSEQDRVSITGLTGFAIGIISLFSLFNLYGFKSRILIFIGNISYELYLFEAVFLWKYNFTFIVFDNKYFALTAYFVFIVILSLIFRNMNKANFKLRRLRTVAKN
jgi:peptidoglycan/LPS O-acetylase OafA/YrhL